MKKKRAALHSYLQARLKKHGSGLSGIDFALPVEVHSIRPSFRTDWEGRPRFQWVIELTQRVPEFTDPKAGSTDGEAEYWFRGGCTLVVDAETGKVRYSIKKPLDDARRAASAAILDGRWQRKPGGHLFRRGRPRQNEPFAMLHRL